MIPADALRRRLDANLNTAQTNVDNAALAVDGFSLEDMQAFNMALRQSAASNWAAGREIVIKHNLVRAIINEIR